MSTSDRTRDPLGLAPDGEVPQVPAPAPVPREPEKLTLPSSAVGFLLQAAIRSEVGNAWWNGFVTAHGVPSWIEAGQWGLQVNEGCSVEVVRVPTGRENGAVGRG